jgi:hypothetical protein
VALGRQRKSTGMPEHVRMGLEAQPRLHTRTLDKLPMGNSSLAGGLG